MKTCSSLTSAISSRVLNVSGGIIIGIIFFKKHILRTTGIERALTRF